MAFHHSSSVDGDGQASSRETAAAVDMDVLDPSGMSSLVAQA
jgi:hypothetical protein